MVKSDQINNKNDEEYHQYSEMVFTIFELSPDAISLTKVSDGEIIDCNLEYLNQIGYSREEVIGHTSLELELFNFDERQVFVNEIRKKQAISDYEIKVKRKDNVFINILYSARFITVNGIQTILCIGKDITERKKVEQQIRQNADLLDQLYDAVIRTDTNFKINYWNKAAEKLFGYSQDEALGINSTELLCPIYAPGERETKSEELKKKGILKTINKFKHKNGTDIIVEQNATQINDNSGVPIGYIVIYHDITVQKKAEEFNQKLLENEQIGKLNDEQKNQEKVAPAYPCFFIMLKMSPSCSTCEMPTFWPGNFALFPHTSAYLKSRARSRCSLLHASSMVAPVLIIMGSFRSATSMRGLVYTLIILKPSKMAFFNSSTFCPYSAETGT